MSERYLVTGVQLGMFIALSDENKRKKIIDEIIEKQFVGNSTSNIEDDANSIANAWVG